MAESDPNIQAVIFDMGGVLVELGPISDLVGSGEFDGSDELFWQQWLSSSAVRDFEMGRCSLEEFTERLADDLSVDSSGQELVDRFLTWPRGLLPGAAQLVNSVPLEVGLLSNTNSLHWFNQADHEVIRDLFDRTYLSFELEMAKPDPEIFDHVVTDLGMPASSVLFLDDNIINIVGAREAGLNAQVAKGVDGAVAALAPYDLGGGE
jgi:HAD superfamily hydrolase (TIGR01509 family)